MLDEEQKKKYVSKVLDLIIKQGVFVIFLLGILGFLVYERYNMEKKMEIRLEKMEIQVDSLRFQNQRLRLENNQCLLRVANLTEIVEELYPKKRQRNVQE